MATYKVIQDIEAEDKILGPLSLRQFIYAGITIALGFIAFRLFVANLWYVALIFIPPALFFGLLSAPLGAQQSSEIWLLAKIRFLVFPRKRVWSQDGIQELVTITVPKKIERNLTKGYSHEEEKSRLKALADTMDTRGWVVKSAMPSAFSAGTEERLFDIAVNQIEPDTKDDIFDSSTNQTAMKLEQMLSESTEVRKQEIVEKIQTPMPVPIHTPAQDDPALAASLKKRNQTAHLSTAHMTHLTISPTSAQTSVKTPIQPMTPPSNPDILKLVNNNDLNVATIAHEAGKQKEPPSDEVVISLH